MNPCAADTCKVEIKALGPGGFEVYRFQLDFRVKRRHFGD